MQSSDGDRDSGIGSDIDSDGEYVNCRLQMWLLVFRPRCDTDEGIQELDDEPE